MKAIEEITINPVIVRNYSILPTNTPIVQDDSSIGIATLASPTVEIAFATPLPDNPASTSSASLKRSATVGLAVAGVSLLSLFGIGLMRRRKHLK